MSDPGYGPNGEKLSPSGLIEWKAIAPPKPVLEGQEAHLVYTLSCQEIPGISQLDDNVWRDMLLPTIPDWLVAENGYWLVQETGEMLYA